MLTVELKHFPITVHYKKIVRCCLFSCVELPIIKLHELTMKEMGNWWHEWLSRHKLYSRGILWQSVLQTVLNESAQICSILIVQQCNNEPEGLYLYLEVSTCLMECTFLLLSPPASQVGCGKEGGRKCSDQVRKLPSCLRHLHRGAGGRRCQCITQLKALLQQSAGGIKGSLCCHGSHCNHGYHKRLRGCCERPWRHCSQLL